MSGWVTLAWICDLYQGTPLGPQAHEWESLRNRNIIRFYYGLRGDLGDRYLGVKNSKAYLL